MLLGIKLIKPKRSDVTLLVFSVFALLGIRSILNFASQIPPSLTDLSVFSIACAFGLHTVGISVRKNFFQFITILSALNFAFIFYRANLFIL